MAIPAGVESVTVTDGGVPITGPDGTPLDGYFTITGPAMATISEDDYLLGGAARKWAVAGRFDPFDLVATDATGLDPQGFTYEITFHPRFAAAWTRYLQLPKAQPTVVLADKLIPDPVTGSYAVLADASTLVSRSEVGVPGGVASLDEGGRVPNKQLPPSSGGSGGGVYLHTQSAPASVWQVAHGLSYPPVIAVTVGGQVVLADIAHASPDLAVITFPSPVAGSATCS